MRHILISGNDNAAKGALMVALSYLAHNEEAVTFHFLTADLSELKPVFVPLADSSAAYIDALLRSKNPESSFLKKDITDIVKSSPLMKKFRNSSYSPYALLRLFADLVDGIPDLVLYLDTDTVIMKNLEPMYSFDISQGEFAAAHDYLGRFWISKNYQNSGVLLMNMANIRETKLLTECRDYLMRHHPILADQDALNYRVQKKYFLPDSFNEQHKENEETLIRHFSKTIRWIPFFHLQNIKPWMIERVHKTLKTQVFDDLFEQFEYHYPRMKGKANG